MSDENKSAMLRVKAGMLLRRFAEIYSALGSGATWMTDSAYRIAVNSFDQIIVDGGDGLALLREAVRQRGDAFDSSRECAAYVLAARELGLLRPNLAA